MTVWEVMVFIETLYNDGNLTRDEYYQLKQLSKDYAGDIKPPHILIYLHRPVEILHKWIKERGNQYEKNIPIEYLEKLEKQYRVFLRDMEENGITQIIELDWTHFGTVDDVFKRLPEEVAMLLPVKVL